MFKIFNVRAGFANNSSSSHSILFMPDDTHIANVCDQYTPCDFGWNNFTISSKEGILDYLNATLSSILEYQMSDEYIRAIANTWTHETEKGYVDHQSIIQFPLSFDRKGIHKGFFDAVKEMLLNNNVLILGGNDQEDEHHLYNENFHGNFSFTNESLPNAVIRYDETEKFWTLFNPNNGFKLRMILDKGERKIFPIKSSAPELVDVKITDYCNYGCRFCYQNSTPEGKHASYDDIGSIIYALSNEEVFEIAYGGGEPTSHPKFIDILKETKRLNIIPNFTTKNLEWLKDNIVKIKDIIGSCAVSVSNSSLVKKIATLIDYHDLNSGKICVQYVLDTDTDYQLESVIRECAKHRVHLTLLGFKTIGRGNGFKRYDNSKWLEIIKKVNKEIPYCLSIGVDTALVQQYEEQIKEFPSWMYHKEEGTFSWYIDAVTKHMGPSSYHELTTYSNIHTDFLKQYQDYSS